MTPTEFIFVRHAQSTANAGSPKVSARDPDPILTARGQQQAASLAERLGRIDVRAIYTSDTSRALATARPIEEKIGLEPREVPDINEWNIGRGGRADERAMRAMFDRWCAGDWDANLEGAPQSETLGELTARVVPAFQSIFDQHASGGGAIVVIAHGGSISWTMPAFARNVGLPYAIRHYLENACSVSVVSKDGTPYVTRWADEAFVLRT